MKKLTNYISILIVCFASACNSGSVQNDKDAVIVIDQSDPLKVSPDADNICSQFDLKDNPFEGIRVSITYISDKDVNATWVVTLPKANRFSGNTQLRAARVTHFKRALHTALRGANSPGSLGHSIIYRTVAKQLNSLSKSGATNKYLLLYSDLMENDETSLYNSKTLRLLRTHPEIIKQQLEKSAALHNLSGIQVWLLYDPASYKENNIYMSIASIYKQVLEAKGATVHIEKTLNLQ